jgi:hypothetical protein
MSYSSNSDPMISENIGKMMGRLGIDMAYAVLPRYGLVFSLALRICNSCTARAACTQWLAKTGDHAFGPPKFCPGVDLLWELLCDPAIGHPAPGPMTERVKLAVRGPVPISSSRSL